MDKTKFVFPVAYDFGRDERGVNEGLTMREYFAAKAMQAMIQSPYFEEGGSEVFENEMQKCTIHSRYYDRGIISN